MGCPAEMLDSAEMELSRLKLGKQENDDSGERREVESLSPECDIRGALDESVTVFSSASSKFIGPIGCWISLLCRLYRASSLGIVRCVSPTESQKREQETEKRFRSAGWPDS